MSCPTRTPTTRPKRSTKPSNISREHHHQPDTHEKARLVSDAIKEWEHEEVEIRHEAGTAAEFDLHHEKAEAHDLGFWFLAGGELYLRGALTVCPCRPGCPAGFQAFALQLAGDPSTTGSISSSAVLPGPRRSA
jgi:hypothetical protein